MKLGSPDYVNRDSDEATEDFMRRIECYENSYESLDEEQDRWVTRHLTFSGSEWVVGLHVAASLRLPVLAAGGDTQKAEVG